MKTTVSNNKFETLTRCPFCESRQISIEFSAPDRINHLPGEFFLSKCTNCHIRFQNPRIKKKYIHEYYPDTCAYLSTFNKRNISPIQKFILKNFYGYFGGTVRPQLAKILRIPTFIPFKPHGKLVEFGCGNGEVLDYFKRLGWHVTGYDNNQHAIDSAKKKSINVKYFDLDKPIPKIEKFDAVIMFMVLEHVYDFRRAIVTAHQILEENGQILITIPTYHGIFHVFNKYSYPLQLPTHLTFFNRPTIHQLLHEAGFIDITISSLPNTKDFTKSLEIYLKAKPNSILRNIPQPIIKICSYIYASLAIFNFSSRLIISGTRKVV